jgi:hypothetical protein
VLQNSVPQYLWFKTRVGCSNELSSWYTCTTAMTMFRPLTATGFSSFIPQLDRQRSCYLQIPLIIDSQLISITNYMSFPFKFRSFTNALAAKFHKGRLHMEAPRTESQTRPISRSLKMLNDASEENNAEQHKAVATLSNRPVKSCSHQILTNSCTGLSTIDLSNALAPFLVVAFFRTRARFPQQVV